MTKALFMNVTHGITGQLLEKQFLDYVEDNAVLDDNKQRKTRVSDSNYHLSIEEIKVVPRAQLTLNQ